jgi:hypothetical protein
MRNSESIAFNSILASVVVKSFQLEIFSNDSTTSSMKSVTTS